LPKQKYYGEHVTQVMFMCAKLYERALDFGV